MNLPLKIILDRATKFARETFSYGAEEEIARVSYIAGYEACVKEVLSQGQNCRHCGTWSHLYSMESQNYKMCEAEYVKFKDALIKIRSITYDPHIEKICNQVLEPGPSKDALIPQ